MGFPWSWQATYVGTKEGALLIVLVDFNDRVAAVPMLSPDPRDQKPLRIHPGMVPPQVRTAPDPVVTGEREITGIVIAETIIDRSGAVSDVRIIKPLPRGLDRIAEDLVRRTTFVPGSLFGVTLPVIYNVTVRVEQGVVHVPQASN